MVIRTGINVNKKNKVEKMTEEEVKALIQELRDEIPVIVQKLHEEEEQESDKKYQKHLKDNK
jgi:hypothetical protein